MAALARLTSLSCKLLCPVSQAPTFHSVKLQELRILNHHLLPALVGSAEGTNIFIASITPSNDAYAPLTSNPNEYSTEVKQIILPNPVSGPAIGPEVFDLGFITATSPL